MPRRIFPLLLVALAAAVTLTVGVAPTRIEAAAAKHKRPPSPSRSQDLWATINVCDSASNPNTIGIRGSMPGLTQATSVFMRFQVQYLAKADGRWHNIDSGADSDWKALGRLRGKVVESGQNFTFLPPTDGGAHHLRGSVRFKWVRGGRVVHRARKFTQSGHRSTAGADPAGYSAAFCDIT